MDLANLTALNKEGANLQQHRLMLFDLALGGHHGNYIRHLIEFWVNQQLSGHLDVVVMPAFLQVHAEVAEWIATLDRSDLRLRPITNQEADSLPPRNSGINRTIRNFQEWQLFDKYAAALGADQALLMYFDTCELPIALGLSAPCPFSGIYFRPTFHYADFASAPLSRKEKLQQWREKVTLNRVLKHPQLQTLFCLDPFAVKHLAQWSDTTTVVPLADPVDPYPSYPLPVETLREHLGIQAGRMVFLLFGALDGRKGIDQLLDAIALLPPDLCQRLCLLLVGATNPTEQALIRPKIERLRQTHPVQVIEHYQFVSEEEVPSYFQLADVVLATYQRHVGMSGILLLAAAAGKPVLSSNYGLMGELVRRYDLGMAVASTVPAAIARGLTHCLSTNPATLRNLSAMQSFAEQNSAQHYARTIFQQLGLMDVPQPIMP